ncbi:putative aminomethyl transferase [Basidiobolus meristosporus CBS 931.73]|uniref:Aminomethyltransferase n=1 Tax=Basidiobolus meristosporus CBS 931.73 TaxID=1314790 RepID=A0A1Y1VUN9_9FUNG|nr:putative aminomethyl transferase [Basidiobolus meristosporus CBS 931.73]ORX93062.1 putative aminomethyl transferase [Basidiobolus meristosporus CBS 931.73]|eukprot:ORX64913.1 putative aminomethyl transferase [Basidiobolus meristosporus CBS 931.73]
MFKNFAQRAFKQAAIRGYASSAAETAASQELKKTALFDLHLQNGAQMVPYAGYSMPVKYASLGVLQSHLHTREKASIFDVSHMLQTRLTGKDRHDFIEKLCVGDIKNLPLGSGTLSVFTNEKGGIIDDTIISQHKDSLYIVSNAGCADKDLAHIRKHLQEFQQKGGDAELSIIDDHSLIAIQGPKAAEALQKLTDKDLRTLNFMTGQFLSIKGIECHVARSGYTGEDGFELSIPTPEITAITELLLQDPDVELAGLGARDSLRLEAGLCLYGNDLNEDITPVEAGLTWTIGKRRREEGGFLGAEHILPQIKGGVSQRRVGLVVQGAPARDHSEILNAEGEKIGEVTSGVPSPSLKKNIAMAYVKNGYHKAGTELSVKVRNRIQKAQVVKMPFVPANYFKA